MTSIPGPSEPAYFGSKPNQQGSPREPWTFWERATWLLLLMVLAFLAGTELGRRQARAEHQLRAAEILAEQARPAEVPDVP